MRVSDYISKTEFKQIKDFSTNEQTPFLIINLNKIDNAFDDLNNEFPFADIYYAVKANPHPEIIKLLSKKGSSFDIASIYELNLLKELGISPDRMSFGNTIKKGSDIKYAYEQGIRLFATDSQSDLEKIANFAPNSKVFFRLLVDGSGADWPLSRKFGAHPDMIHNIILGSKKLPIIPYGLSFHVGSQQRDIGQWDNAIAQCRYLFDALKQHDIELQMINLGGGFPAKYDNPTKPLSTYAREIKRFLEEDFGPDLPRIILEPGRSIVGDAGVIVSEIVNISKKSKQNQYPWVFLDVGKFGGLIETIDECIRYPIITSYEKPSHFSEVILAGPTCDSMDVLYEKMKYMLPSNIREGDRVFILTTGAYTTSYSSICFNGFPPLKEFVLGLKKK